MVVPRSSGGAFRINGESGPLSGHSVILVQYRKKSLGAKVKLLKAKILHEKYILIIIIIIIIIINVGRDSSVGTATHYGLDGPRIESRCGTRFSTAVQSGPGAHPTSYTMGTGSFPGVKRPGRGVDHPHSCSAEVVERV